MSKRMKTMMVSFLLLLLLLCGCSSLDRIRPLDSLDLIRPLDQFLGETTTGQIFTHIRVPYTRDLNNTPVTNIHADGIVFHVSEPLSGLDFYVELNSNAIGDIAKRHGLTKVYFADIEIFDVLGIWHHEKLHIYGE